jgi:hypothetical protein
LVSADEYDLLIITNSKFSSDLQPLVDHKNSIGVRTVMDTVQNIYPAYSGRDDAEDIKLRIKDAVEDWGIKYVLLAGGRKGQTFDWYVPSRRSNNVGSGWEGGYESDLYFADLYKIVDDEVVFEDWDSNGNGVFAEWSNLVGGRETIDYYPDVYVSRLPFRYSFELAPMIQKIVNYENNADDSWYKKAVVIAGDTSPPARGASTGWYEGELETQLTTSLLEADGFQVTKLWTSLGTLTGSNSVINAINNGAGMIQMTGHGNPASLGTYMPNAESEEGFIDILLLTEMRSNLNNGDELPVIIVGGCHNAQFNVTMSNIIEGIKTYGINGYFFSPPNRFYYMEWVPRSFCSQLVLQRSGGAIASIGCSGLGIGYINQHWNSGLSGWLDPRFFDAVANQSKEIVSEAHGQAITDYINIIGSVNSDYADRKTIEEWTLIGDPSLKLGGY